MSQIYKVLDLLLYPLMCPTVCFCFFLLKCGRTPCKYSNMDWYWWMETEALPRSLRCRFNFPTLSTTQYVCACNLNILPTFMLFT